MKQKGTDYTNCVSQLEHKQTYLIRNANRNIFNKLNAPQLLFILLKNDMYGWCRLIIANPLPFSSVERETIRRHVKYNPISLNTLIKCIGLLTTEIEEKYQPLY